MTVKFHDGSEFKTPTVLSVHDGTEFKTIVAMWSHDGTEFKSVYTTAVSQYLRPGTDVTVIGWAKQDGTTGTLYAVLDETTSDTADYIKTTQLGRIYQAKMHTSSFTDPGVDTGHVMRATFGFASTGSSTEPAVDPGYFGFEIWQGPAATGTLIASGSGSAYEDFGGNFLWENFEYTLSTTEASNITDYGNLHMRGKLMSFSTYGHTGSIAWLEFETP